MKQACRAETRSQGIATRNRAPAAPEPEPRVLQSRDPFSGDCDAVPRESPGNPSGQSACRAETRSQGIATRSCARRGQSRGPPLAEPRPVLRGLRRSASGSGSISRNSILQSRDPFSGDCDSKVACPTKSLRFPYLQSRDPFSGDCDYPQNSARRKRDLRLLAEPRPVLRGLRPSGLEAIQALISYLAEPRPVLRGLRREARTARSSTPGRQACRAETRSQGIATLRRRQECWQLADQPCRAETRSQGIATWDSAGLGSRSRRSSPLAEPRPVLRGLRPGACGHPNGLQGDDLQSRDPFSGDCDSSGREQPNHVAHPDLQSRDPFSGDCDLRAQLTTTDVILTCRAETRSQGIATKSTWASMAMTRSTCRAETRSQGIATIHARPRSTRRPGILQSCRAETRSQGIATPAHSPKYAGQWTSSSCRAETRSQGIATGRLCLVGQSDPDHRLQSRDPFSGDCDSPPT